ncbi:hypothetical protein J6590_020627 [Homalodisca vitripennis]|nr:hypothetical protein J6590_020627 [Homalodisca vitripennis]
MRVIQLNRQQWLGERYKGVNCHQLCRCTQIMGNHREPDHGPQSVPVIVTTRGMSTTTHSVAQRPRAVNHSTILLVHFKSCAIYATDLTTVCFAHYWTRLTRLIRKQNVYRGFPLNCGRAPHYRAISL